MKKETVYTVINGEKKEVFFNEAEAEKRERELEFNRVLKKIVREDVAYNEYQETVYIFIQEHKKELTDLFSYLNGTKEKI